MRVAIVVGFSLVLAACAGPAMQDPPAAETPPLLTSPWLALAPLTIAFDYGDATVNAADRAAIQDVAQKINKARPYFRVQVKVIGHTDSAEARNGDPRLSLRRAKAVEAELLNARVSFLDIEVDGRGGNEPAVATQPGALEPKNRRVEIEFVRK